MPSSISSPTGGGTEERPPREWLDRFIGSDPGMTRLRLAVQATVTIAVAMVAERAFVQVTHALQVPAPPGMTAVQEAQAQAQHHGVLVIAIMLGAIMGMMASFAATMFPSKRLQVLALGLMPVPMVAGLAIGLSLADNRTLALVSFVAILAAGGYLRRYGPWGFFGGQLVFLGDFFGFFLHGVVDIGDIGWLAAEICLGILVAIVAQFTLFFPSRKSSLRRMQQSFDALARRVADAARDVVDRPEDEARGRRLPRLLVRLNETALMVDAQLGDPAALPPGVSASMLHQRLFDIELALTDLARFAGRVAVSTGPVEHRQLVRRALTGVITSDLDLVESTGREILDVLHVAEISDPTTAIIAHRFADSAIAYAAARRSVRQAVAVPESDPENDEEFTPSVELVGGYLPGSSAVSGEASSTGMPEGAHRVRLPAYGRVAIQMGVAVTGAIVLGSLLSERRFYWAVIAAFVTFMGAHNAAEQLRKGMLRVVGTVVGVFLGALVVHLTGDNLPLSIAVILASLFLGLYFMRVSYAFMVVGITVMVSELYVQLNEFSDSLLVLRLEETAIGAAVAAATVLFVVPLRTARVARTALRNYLLAIVGVTEAAVTDLGATGTSSELRTAARHLDAEYQALVAVMKPLRNPLPGAANGPRRRLLQSAAASRYYGRNLLVDTSTAAPLPRAQRTLLDDAGERLLDSVDAILTRLDTDLQSERPYVRAASLFNRISGELAEREQTSPTQLAMRDFQLLDESMATFAELLRLPVQDLDTPSCPTETERQPAGSGGPG